MTSELKPAIEPHFERFNGEFIHTEKGERLAHICLVHIGVI